MLTEEANNQESERHNHKIRTRDQIISRLMDKLDEKEDEFGKFELDNARQVLVTEDSEGNARVRRQS